MAFDGSTLAAATDGTFVSGVFSDTFVTLAADVDIVRLELTAGMAYTLDIDIEAIDFGDVYLRVFDQYGIEVKANDDGFRFTEIDDGSTSNPWTAFLPNYTGSYFVAVSPYFMRFYDPITLENRISVKNVFAGAEGILTVTEDGPATWPEAGSITGIVSEGAGDEAFALRDADRSIRVQYDGVIDTATDVDFAGFNGTKGDVIAIDVNGLDGNGTVVRVFDAAGFQFATDDDSGTGEDAELVFGLLSSASVVFRIGISGDGNDSYFGLTGGGTVAGTTGAYEVIIHRNPTIWGTGLTNAIDGTDGDDYVVSLGSADTVGGLDGNDTLAGGDDEDSLNGDQGRDVLYGEAGDDSLHGGEGNDVLSGGQGTDSLLGGNGDDLIEGNAGADKLFGEAGNDTMSGGAGNDSLTGGLGADDIEGGLGNDRLNGGIDDDTLAGNEGNDVCSGVDGDDLLVGGFGNDRLYGGLGNDVQNGQAGRDELVGADGDDRLSGGKGIDTLYGGIGNDSLLGDAQDDDLGGGDGDDTLSGGSDADTLAGAAGDDRLEGGTGDNRLTGGEGADTFVFATVGTGVDLVMDIDFVAGDLIDLAAVFDATGAVVTAANLSQFVQTTSVGGGADSFLGIDSDGVQGGLAFVIIAQIIGVTSAQLFDSDNFLL